MRILIELSTFEKNVLAGYENIIHKALNIPFNTGEIDEPFSLCFHMMRKRDIFSLFCNWLIVLHLQD